MVKGIHNGAAIHGRMGCITLQYQIRNIFFKNSNCVFFSFMTDYPRVKHHLHQMLCSLSLLCMAKMKQKKCLEKTQSMMRIGRYCDVKR